MGTRRAHRMLGLILLLPICGWAVTGFVFFIKPGYEVLVWQPEVVFIACCGFGVERTLCDLPSLQSVPGWKDVPAVRSDRVYVTDGSHYF